MDSLFNRIVDFDDTAFRNIVSLKESVDLFSDLSEGFPEVSETAVKIEMHVKRNLEPSSPAVISRSFHYSTAIGYPFEKEPFMFSRFSDGTYGVWYGSLEEETTLYETAYHMIVAETNIESNSGVIIRERSMYTVHCSAILFDFRKKEKKYPKLIDKNSYDYTQTVGKRVATEGHPGIITPSSRCNGANIVIFNPRVLSNPKLQYYLSYELNLDTKIMTVNRNSVKIHTILFDEI